MVPAMPDFPLARKMWRTLEPYHGVAYFTEKMAAFAEIGLKGSDAYFAPRAAPLGVVPAAVVEATFFNFHPDRVRASIPAVWERTTPEAATAARWRVADEGLRADLGDDLPTRPEVAEAADLARAAADAATTELAGRPLFAAHAALDWPDEPHLVLWHAATLLREHRGDGHIAALVAADLGACEALVTYGATGELFFNPKVLQTTRGWSDAEWADATDRLRDRGWLEADGTLTETGRAARQHVEDVTDEVAARPWRAIGEDRADRLRALVRPLSRALASSGTFGRSLFG
jgi:hypothetical protein